jgi:hypothetical protein
MEVGDEGGEGQPADTVATPHCLPLVLSVTVMPHVEATTVLQVVAVNVPSPEELKVPTASIPQPAPTFIQLQFGDIEKVPLGVPPETEKLTTLPAVAPTYCSVGSTIVQLLQQPQPPEV